MRRTDVALLTGPALMLAAPLAVFAAGPVSEPEAVLPPLERWQGRSHEGREIRMVIASGEGATTPEELNAAGRPVLLAQGGIHSGEIDGKDAGLMRLRDLTVGGRLGELLDRASLLFVPILSVDGQERSSSPYGRINQRGPAHPVAREPAPAD